MSRSNDVSTAMQYAKSGVDGVHLMDSHKATIGWVVNTLAAEVERLEKANAELIAETHRWSAADKASTRQRDEQRRELLQRAEAADRRVALLIHTVAQLSAVLAEAGAPQDPANAIEMAAWAQSVAKAEARVRELETQHARLRAALEDVSLLAHCISKAGPLNTPDLETAWRKFDLISVKAAEALVDRKAALSGGEASK